MREVPTLVCVPEKLGDKIGRYQLLQHIGEGGCGIVYMAEQEEPIRRRGAHKVIKLGMDTAQVIARFEAERQALALMDHPNIAKVYDAGATDAGRPFFVMELVRGIKITDYCDQNRLSGADRLQLFIQVCQAIQHAHQKGIIHRDIKPSNVLVTQHDGVPLPKVIDFGVAKATTNQRLTDKTVFTAFEQFIGTPAYMSPEQAEMSALDIDTRSDIYSLGVLLYELLTGETPFDARELLASGLDAMRRTIREKEPPRPSTRLTRHLAAAGPTESQSASRESRIDPDLDWIVLKCLEKDRTRRYETANGLAADLKRHLANEPVVARPPSTAYRFQRAFRRHKLAFAASGAVLCALLVGLGTTSWQWGRAERQRRFTQHRLYVQTMNGAQAAWEGSPVSRVPELLRNTATSERGFEWYYWQRQLHQDLMTFRGHQASLLAVAYSPDGKRIVTGGADHIAWVWDVATGQALLPLRGHRDPIRSVAFSADNRHIATASWDHTAKVWDLAGAREPVTFTNHTREVFSVAFSPDGQQVVTGSFDQTGAGRLTFRGDPAAVLAIAYSPDSRRIITGGMDHTARISSIAFSPDGRQLVTAGGGVTFSPGSQFLDTFPGNHTAKIWDASGSRESRVLEGHSNSVWTVVFSADEGTFMMPLSFAGVFPVGQHLTVEFYAEEFRQNRVYWSSFKSTSRPCDIISPLVPKSTKQCDAGHGWPADTGHFDSAKPARTICKACCHERMATQRSINAKSRSVRTRLLGDRS